MHPSSSCIVLFSLTRISQSPEREVGLSKRMFSHWCPDSVKRAFAFVRITCIVCLCALLTKNWGIFQNEHEVIKRRSISSVFLLNKNIRKTTSQRKLFLFNKKEDQMLPFFYRIHFEIYPLIFVSCMYYMYICLHILYLLYVLFIYIVCIMYSYIYENKIYVYLI